MNTPYRSLYGFGIYAVLAGLTFFLYPAIFDLMGLPVILDDWARLVGLLALVVGCYYLVNAASGYRPLFYRLGLLISLERSGRMLN